MRRLSGENEGERKEGQRMKKSRAVVENERGVKCLGVKGSHGE